MKPRVFVVANPPEGERIAGWLSDLPANIRVGDGSDDTLTAIQEHPTQVVVLTAGLATGDALAFAGALWEGGSETQLVLIADEGGGPVRTAIDAMEFRADRFLSRPLSRSALVFAVKSCLNLANIGRPGVAQAVSTVRRTPSGRRPLSAAFAALGDIAPVDGPAEVSSGVAVHTLALRIEQATHDAVDAFLNDAVASVLSTPPVEELEPVAGAPEEQREERPPEWRESTMVLSSTVNPAPPPPAYAAPPPPAPPPETPPPQPPRDNRTGTFVSALRRHMSAVEARLFGEPAEAEAPRGGEEDSGDIDLDSIGVTTLSSLSEEGRGTTSVEHTPPPLAPLTGPGTRSTPPPPAVLGSLADEDMATLLGRLARERLTGRVLVRHGREADVTRTVLLEDGRPVFAGSTAPGDRMGDQLVREGKITRAQLVRAQEILVASGRRMGEILVELGYLKRRELLPAVRRHVEDILYSLFAWEDGSVSVASGAGGREEKIRLATPAPAIVIEGIRRKHGLERLRALVGPGTTVLLPVRREDASEALGEAELSAEERHAVDLFDGQRTVAEVAAAGPGELVAGQVAHFLLALGMASRMPREATETGRATTGVSAPGAPASSITGAADAAIDRERVLAKHAHVREADYFELLGVRRDASAFEIRRAFEAARRDYAPESFASEVQRELSGELAEIAEVLVEAQRVLRNDGVRAAYLENLADRGE